MADPSPSVEAAGGVVFTDSGRVALVHRPRWDDWTLPKGHLESGETAREAALREVEEETGLRCTVVGKAGTTRYVDHRDRPKRVRYFTMRLIDAAAESQPFVPNDEVDDLRWVDISGIDLLTHAHDRDLVRAAWPAERNQREL